MENWWDSFVKSQKLRKSYENNIQVDRYSDASSQKRLSDSSLGEIFTKF